MQAATPSKHQIRRDALAARRRLSAEERDELSICIAEHVAGSRYFASAKRIGCYLPMADEVDTWSLIERAWRRKKRIFVPVVGKNFRLSFRSLTPDSELATNRFGLWEPLRGKTIAVGALDTILVPVVAFDEHCNRIGMGGGYYDRALARHRHRQSFHRPKLIGLSFACQQVALIPASPWDIPLFQIYTEAGAMQP